ncbi:MAG: SUMF1/EgtB/PvdO family nonheme iron enzyme [Hylemonella sp.]|nr:SUMF1/EgtB/PvdO family nonheme iron enzyme [Hylemonella sp.]
MDEKPEQIRNHRRLKSSATEAPTHTLRGGSWNNNPDNARCSYRNRNQPDNWNNNIGFRVVLSIDGTGQYCLRCTAPRSRPKPSSAVLSCSRYCAPVRGSRANSDKSRVLPLGARHGIDLVLTW